MTGLNFPALTSVFRALSMGLLLLLTALPLMAAQDKGKDPKASDGVLTVKNGRTTLGYLKATGDKGTVLTYEIVAQGSKGRAALIVGNRLGAVTFSMNTGVNPLGTDRFTFRVTDSNGRVSNTAAVSITFVNDTVITWPQPTPITYGTPLSTPATATAGGVVVQGTFVYQPHLGTVLNAGTRRVTAEFNPAGGGAKLTRALNVRVLAATLRVTSNASKVYAAALPALVPAYSGFVNGDTAASVLTGAPTLRTTATATSAVGNHPITVTRGSLRANGNYTLTYVNGILAVTPAPASITLGSLTHPYDGNGHAAGITTAPANLATTVTYAGGTALPVGAGSYAVVASIANPNYAGTASGTLVITKANATVTLAGLTHTYDGTGHAAVVTTTPAGLGLVVSYNASELLPLNAGRYEVVASILDANYEGSGSDHLVIAKAPAQVIFSELAHTYDGSGHAAAVTTIPAGLPCTITYDGGAVLPVAAGTVAVVASIDAPNHHGAANGALIISQASQSIAFAALHDVEVGDAAQVLTATASSGLPVTLSVSGPAVIVGGLLEVTGAGTVTVTASQVGDGNHLPALPVVHTVIASESGGLVASYFANETLSGAPVLVRTESQIDHDWADGSPAPGVPMNSFSVRWDGEIQTRFDEAYTLTFRTDDGVRVWLDGALVVDAWNLRSVADSEYTFNAVAGRRYRVRIEYYEHTGLAVAKLWWRSASEASGPIPADSLIPIPPDTSGPIGTGSGLTASYFANETLAGIPAVTRVDTMHFDWAGGSPASSILNDSFSARWSGELQPRYSEPYTITVRTDDGVRMWLDGQLVIDHWFLRGAANSDFTFPAEAGRRYAVRIEYYEHLGSAVAQLSWYSAREASGPIPATQLYPLPTPVVSVADVAAPLAEDEAITLAGTVSDIGSAAIALAWTASGPGPVNFLTPNQADTVARFAVAGTYEVKLWAFNGHLTVNDSTIVTVVASDISSDLVAHYAFDETSGTSAYDSSGKQHTGVVIDASRATGKSRGALHFNGASYVYALSNEDLDAPIQALTLAVWLRPDATLAQMAHPWPMPIYRAQYEDSSGYALMATANDSDQFGLRLHHQAGTGQMVEANTTAAFTPGAWVHATGVYDGTTAKLYLDGVLVQSVATGPITLRQAPHSPLFLGYGFVGLMDDVRIYHRALTRTDLYALAQDGSDRRTPGVDAGSDRIVTLLTPTTTLSGSASDDAGSGTTLMASWKQVAGPAASTFDDKHRLAPQVTFAVAGSYRFQLTVSDGVLSGSDEMRVEVDSGAVDLTSGLILHYRADEVSGTLVADTSGRNHAGTYLGNPQWNDEGRFLGALQLDGASVVTTPSAADLSGLSQMTLALWMRADRALVDMAHPWPFAMNHADYAGNRGFALMTTVADTNTFGFRLHTGTGRREVTMEGVAAGTWVQVVATFDGQTMRLFRDGVLIDSNVTGAIPLPPLDAPLQVGEGFEGLLDDVRIYDRALSPTEVQSLHALVPLAASG